MSPKINVQVPKSGEIPNKQDDSFLTNPLALTIGKKIKQQIKQEDINGSIKESDDFGPRLEETTSPLIFTAEKNKKGKKEKVVYKTDKGVNKKLQSMQVLIQQIQAQQVEERNKLQFNGENVEEFLKESLEIAKLNSEFKMWDYIIQSKFKNVQNEAELVEFGTVQRINAIKDAQKQQTETSDKKINNEISELKQYLEQKFQS